jgi:hypothetical protein
MTLVSRYRKSSLSLAAATLLGIVGAVALIAPASALDVKPRVVPPDSRAYGVSYAEWSVRWWQWAVSIPVPDSPLLDQTGENCAVGQSGRVWFLAGTVESGSATRTCTVPRGRALFFPIINSFCANDPGDNKTYEEELACARDLNAGATGSAEIDGRPIRNVQRYRVESPAFSLTLPEDNIYGAPPGIYAPAAAVGIYLLLRPLSVGQHVIHFTGSTAGGTAIEVTYHLTVCRRAHCP